MKKSVAPISLQWAFRNTRQDECRKAQDEADSDEAAIRSILSRGQETPRPSSSGEFVDVISSNVEAVAHNEEGSVLLVRFKGGSVYEYAGVPADTYVDLLAAPSVGRFLNQHIKGNYPYQKVSTGRGGSAPRRAQNSSRPSSSTGCLVIGLSLLGAGWLLHLL